MKYGKWVLVAGSLGMNYLAVRAHNRAEDTDVLWNRGVAPTTSGVPSAPPAPMRILRSRASIRPRSGTTAGPGLWLIGGETALAGAAVLFVWELTRPKGRPDNIPFEPEVRSLRAGGTGFGDAVCVLMDDGDGAGRHCARPSLT